MENETQNQNIDTPAAQEEAPAQPEAPQNQDIGVQEASPQQQPVVEEAQAAPQQAMDDAQAATSEVHDDPGVPQQQEQQQGIADDISDIEWDEPPELMFNGGDAGWQPGSSTQAEEPTSDGSIWDSLSSDFPEVEWGEPDYTSNGGYAGWDSQLGEEWSEDVGGPGSVISGGAIDYGYAEFGDESDKVSADVISEQEEVSEAQSDFTDADYQEVLDDLDNGNIDDVREFLEGLDLSDDDYTQEEAQDAPGVPEEEGKLVDKGISIDDVVGGEEKVEGGPENANDGTEEYAYDEEAYEDAQDAFESLRDAIQHGDEEDRAEALEELQGYFGGSGKGEEGEEDTSSGGYDGSGIAGGLDLDQDGVFDQIENDPDLMSDDEGYTYNEESYKDAEHAMKDLKHALKHGDEEDRAEALEKLQGYLGGFDKGDAEEDQDGTEETQDDQIPSVSENDSDGDHIQDFVDSDGNGTDDRNEDSDGDGIVGWFDSDADGNGQEDWLVEDSDGDGVYDLLDSDANGDGINDWDILADPIDLDPYEFDCF